MATGGDCGSLGVGARVTVPAMLVGVAAGGGANIIQETLWKMVVYVSKSLIGLILFQN